MTYINSFTQDIKKLILITITVLLMMGGVCWGGIDNPIGNMLTRTKGMSI